MFPVTALTIVVFGLLVMLALLLLIGIAFIILEDDEP